MHNKEDIENYKNRIKAATQDKDIIAGIHSYCDRWCERCTHTKHCSVFKMEQLDKEENGDEDLDLNNKKFWEKLSLTFAATLDMVSEEAERFGIDLKEIAEQDLEPPKERKKSIAAKSSFDYGIKMHNWLEENNELISQRGKTLLIISDEKVVEFSEAIEVVRWYCTLIGAKVNRAYHDSLMEDEDPIQNDNHGSAKIALISINRSIEALSLLLEELKEKEDDILDFLVTLAKLKNLVEAKFPNAWKFQRPGFDD